MPTFTEVQEAADQLSSAEQFELITHLLARMPDAPLGPDDAEVLRRDAEMESGEVKILTHEEFLAAVGRR